MSDDFDDWSVPQDPTKRMREEREHYRELALVTLPERIATLERELSEARSILEDAGKVLGEVCVAATLRPGESLVEPNEHAAVAAILNVLRERDTIRHVLSQVRDGWEKTAGELRLVYKELGEARKLLGECAKEQLQAGLKAAYRALYDHGYNRGQADAAPRWVPVGELLPPIDAFVTVCSADGVVQWCAWRWNGTVWACSVDDVDSVASNEITHWRPLPPPPKGEP